MKNSALSPAIQHSKIQVRPICELDRAWITGLLTNPRVCKWLPFPPMSQVEADTRFDEYLKYHLEKSFYGTFVLEMNQKNFGI